jgi:hypothetical protein
MALLALQRFFFFPLVFLKEKKRRTAAPIPIRDRVSAPEKRIDFFKIFIRYRVVCFDIYYHTEKLGLPR